MNELDSWKRITFVLPEPGLAPIGQGKVLARPAQASTIHHHGLQTAIERARAAKTVPSRFGSSTAVEGDEHAGED